MKLVPSAVAAGLFAASSIGAHAVLLDSMDTLAIWENDGATSFGLVGSLTEGTGAIGMQFAPVDNNPDPGTTSYWQNLIKGFGSDVWVAALAGQDKILVDVQANYTPDGTVWWNELVLVFNMSAGGWQQQDGRAVPTDGTITTLEWDITPALAANIAASAGGFMGIHFIVNAGGDGTNLTQLGNPPSITVDNLRAVPEPSTWAMIGGAAALSAAVILRRRRS